LSDIGTNGCGKHTEGGSIDLLNGGVAQTIGSAEETIETACEVNLGAPACLTNSACPCTALPSTGYLTATFSDKEVSEQDKEPFCMPTLCVEGTHWG